MSARRASPIARTARSATSAVTGTRHRVNRCRRPRPTETSVVAAFAQPLGRDPLLALEHRRTRVQRAGHRVRPVVAEEHRVALDRSDFEAGLGGGGRTGAAWPGG